MASSTGFDPGYIYGALRRMGMSNTEAKDIVDMIIHQKQRQGMSAVSPLFSSGATPSMPPGYSGISSYGSVGIPQPPISVSMELTENDLEDGDEVRTIASYMGDSFTGIYRGQSTYRDRLVAIEIPGRTGGAQNNWWNLEKSDIKFLEIVKKKKSKPKAKLVFEPAKLDALVIDQKVKDEIVAVLQQHKNHDKLFDEWGLGEIIEYGRGMTFMFYGGPGTGKTYGATCIAKALGTELLVLSAAEIQSSEPGGANRAIQEAFKEAKRAGKVIFLDECDSLIASRNDLGMVLASEVNTLLTEIEKFEGVAILATNRVEHMDEALERRISLIVEFPKPDYENRKKIWARLLPKKMPLAKEVVIEDLAKEELTGGQIKNIVLQAARMALAGDCSKVDKKHFDLAIARIKKSKNLMGSASRYRQGIVRDDFTVGHGQKTKTRGFKDFLKSDIDIDEDITTDTKTSWE